MTTDYARLMRSRPSPGVAEKLEEQPGGGMTGRATVTRTKSGNLRGSVDPQALARTLETLQGRMTALEQQRDEARFLALQQAREAREYQASELAAEMEELVTGFGMDSGLPDRATVRQASTRADPWAGDAEHSESYMDAIRNGTPLPELRRRSAEDAVRRAIAHEPNPVIYEAPAWCGRNGCRPAMPCPACAGHRVRVRDGSVTEAPPQRSVVHNEWEQFPDHAPVPPPDFRAPEFAQARARAPQVPGGL